MNNQRDRLTTIARAAATFDVDRSTLKRWIESGFLAALRRPGASRKFYLWESEVSAKVALARKKQTDPSNLQPWPE